MKEKCKCGNDKFFLEKKKVKQRNEIVTWIETIGSLICTKCGKKKCEWSE